MINQTEKYSGTNILITGGTGSFGNQFVSFLNSLDSPPKKIIIYSRDEMKQHEMRKKFDGNASMRYFLGDVRDHNRLKRAMHDVDYVVHAAANKIVPYAEYDPLECIKTNITGAMNVVDCAIDCGVKGVVALSTDKASSPVNLYGATKLVSDKVFVAANNYGASAKTKFSVVRYGNVMGSRGSVIPLFLKMRDTGCVTITDPRMTRFMIDLKQGVELVNFALHDMVGGEIYVRKIPSMDIISLANVVAPNCRHDFIGVRPGEKLHEEMISVEDSFTTYEYDDYYKILPTINEWFLDSDRIKSGKRVDYGFRYASDSNREIMTPEALENWLKSNEQSLKD